MVTIMHGTVTIIVCVSGEMLKFLCICLVAALGAVLSIPMEMTTLRPEATTEDTSGRLLTLPDPEKCAQSKQLVNDSIVKNQRTMSNNQIKIFRTETL